MSNNVCPTAAALPMRRPTLADMIVERVSGALESVRNMSAAQRKRLVRIAMAAL